MATTAVIVGRGRIPGHGEIITWEVDLDATTSHTIADRIFSKVYSLSVVDTTSTSGVGEAIFDGTNIKIAGCTNGATVYVTAIGR